MKLRHVKFTCCALLLTNSLSFAGDLPLPAEKGGEPPLPAMAGVETPVEGAATFKVADAQKPIDIPEKGFAIKSPAGWTYATNFPGATLVMQASASEDPDYRRSISVTSYSDAMEVTDTNVTDFQKWLIKQFSQGDSGISGYQVRNHLPVDLDGGIKGHLFYTEFTVNSVEMMQMHVLVSAEDRHFIVTYTDLATYFDVSEKPSEHLNQAWEAINTITLKDPIVPPMVLFMKYAGVGVAALGLLVCMMLWRRRSQQKKFEAMDQQKHDDNGRPLTHSPESINPISLSIVKIRDEVPSEDDADKFDDDKDIDFDQDKDGIKRVS